ncbi:hypothetical protein ACCT04_36210, partial [Rhizobium ruizarguesonis]
RRGPAAARRCRCSRLAAICPAPRRDSDPGFWVAKDVWSPTQMQCFYVEQFGKLTEGMPIPHAQDRRIPRLVHDAGNRSPFRR